MNESDKWAAELRSAGWIAVRTTMWKSPSGQFYLGPYRAWQVMCAQQGRVTVNEGGDA